MIKVRNLDPMFRERFGPEQHMDEVTAREQEALGRVRIVDDENKQKDSMGRALNAPQSMASDYLRKTEWAVKKKARVAWVQDRSLVGGAELSNMHVVDVGERLGFDIVAVSPDNFDRDGNRTTALLKSADVIIINNIFEFNAEAMSRIKYALYEERVPYVKYEHDHRELGRVFDARQLFNNSILNVFLSPVHRDNHRDALGVDGICLPLAVDTEFFKPVEGIARHAGRALVSGVRTWKKWTNLKAYIEEHPELVYVVLADTLPMELAGDNVKLEPMVPASHMPTVYSQAEYVVHLLDGWGAGERVIFEAALCGCTVIANDFVGHTSWSAWQQKKDDPEALRAWLKPAPFSFWREVEGAMS
jgi:hypothetical protein